MQLNEKFLKTLKRAHNILITTHIYPDADGIGSQISLCLALNQLGKKALCFNQEALLGRYKYLDPSGIVHPISKINELNFKPDLIIVVDTNTKERTGKKMLQYYIDRDEEQNKETDFLFIDHHPCADENLDNYCIDTSAAATGQIAGELIQLLKIPFTQEMALALYTAIIIDTSSFRYPTVSPKTHALVAELLKTGIKPTTAYNGIYGTKGIEHLHLLGKVLSTANTNKNGDIYWIVFNQNDLDEFQTDIEDTHAFINNLLIMDNIKVACMIRDDGEFVKVSLRSLGGHDVSHIAQILGGGGHSHSAATIIEKTKPLDEIIAQTIKTIEENLS
jgi:phosphoesterase RecJ-like protein